MEYKKHVSNRIKDPNFKLNFVRKICISSLLTIYILIFEKFNAKLLEHYSIENDN